VPYEITLPTRSAFNSLLASIGPFDPMRGYLFVPLLDCGLDPMVDVELELSTADDRTRIFYWDQLAPAADATATLGYGATISFVPTDLAGLLTAKDVKTGNVVASASVLPMKGAFTVLGMIPNWH
jgi:hypothetical protein